MPKYRFCVKAPNGKVRRGTVNEVDLEAARLRLVKAGFEVLELGKEAELVIETPTALPGHSGRVGAKFQRAAILEFDETPWERLVGVLRTYLLRKEAAVAFLVLGVVVIGARLVLAPKDTAPTKPVYLPYTIEVTVVLGDFDGRTVRVSLPEIPFTHSVPTDVSPVGGEQTVTFEIETLTEPRAVGVRLLDATGNVLATGESTLASGEGDSLRSKVHLEPAVEKPSAP